MFYQLVEVTLLDQIGMSRDVRPAEETWLATIDLMVPFAQDWIIGLNWTWPWASWYEFAYWKSFVLKAGRGIGVCFIKEPGQKNQVNWFWMRTLCLGLGMVWRYRVALVFEVIHDENSGVYWLCSGWDRDWSMSEITHSRCWCIQPPHCRNLPCIYYHPCQVWQELLLECEVLLLWWKLFGQEQM